MATLIKNKVPRGINGSGKSPATQVLLKILTTSAILAYPHWIRFGYVEWFRRRKPISTNYKQEASISGTITALEKGQSRLENTSLRSGWLLLNLAYMVLFYKLKVRIST